MARYIELDKLLSKSKTVITGYARESGEPFTDSVIFVSDVDSFPTANVKEVVKGEWRAYTTNAYIGGKKEFANRKFYRCSECRYGSVIKSDFCPNCGADMRKEET